MVLDKILYLEVSLICFDQLNVTVLHVDVKLNFTKKNC